MWDRIDQAIDILEGIALYSCVLLVAIVAIAAPISMIFQALEPAPARAAHVTRFENFCDPEWKALEQYGARVNCYQE
jgi:hypothetical protein